MASSQGLDLWMFRCRREQWRYRRLLPVFHQKQGKNFCIVGQKLHICTGPDSRRTAFIEADLALECSMVADGTVEHGANSLRCQNFVGFRCQIANIMTVEYAAFIKFIGVAGTVCLVRNALKILYFGGNSLGTPFKSIYSIRVILAVLKNIDPADIGLFSHERKKSETLQKISISVEIPLRKS